MLTVYEDRAAGSGRQIDLHIAVIPALSRSPAPDPLFFLTCGPGQAATESYLFLAPAFDKINQSRDIVLLDQRGTGGSHPLQCPLLDDAHVTDDQQLTAWVTACRDSLDADLKLYTTVIGGIDHS